MSQDMPYKIHIWITWRLVNKLDPLVSKLLCDSCVSVSNCKMGSPLPGLSLLYHVCLYIFYITLAVTEDSSNMSLAIIEII